MNKILRRLGFLCLLLVVIALAYSYFSFNNYSPEDIACHDINSLSYYSNSYDEAADMFLDKCSLFPNVQLSRFQVPSATDNHLYTDICYIPPTGTTDKLMIVTSGVHGIEGYTGSAIQSMFLDKLNDMHVPCDMGFIFVHALNPYGFKYGRKVTENNVDLNRNCVLDTSEYGSVNDGFTKIYDMLTPGGAIDISSFWNRSFHLVAISEILKESMGVLRQAALQGQYEYAEGIYYGGRRYEPQIDSVMPIIRQYINNYETVLNLDLHTGYGARGQLHLFIDRPENKAIEQGIETVFAGHDIDWSEGADFYTINGEYIALVAQQADSALVIPMLMEFGTMNSQETMGSLKSIHTMISENQGANNGYIDIASERKVKADMMELYCPRSQDWRTITILKADSMFDSVLSNFSQM